MRTTTVNGTELDSTGTPLAGLVIAITLETDSALPLVFKNAANGADPDNGKLLNSGVVVTLSADSGGAWSTPLVAPLDIAGRDASGTYVAVTATYSIRRGTVTTDTRAFAYSVTPLSVATLWQTTTIPGITTATMWLDVRQLDATADPGEIVTVRLSQDAQALCDDLSTTVALYATTPYTATTDALGRATFALVPSSRLPAGVFYWASLHIGSAQYAFVVPDGGGDILQNLVTPITAGGITVLAPNMRERGLWDVTAAYALHDVVRYAGDWYITVQPSAGFGQAPNQTAYWRRLSTLVSRVTATGVVVPFLGGSYGLTATAGTGTVGAHISPSTTYYYSSTTRDADFAETTVGNVVSFVQGVTPVPVALAWTTPDGAKASTIYRGTSADPTTHDFLSDTNHVTGSFVDDGTATPNASIHPPATDGTGKVRTDNDITTYGHFYERTNRVVLDDGTNMPAASAAQLGGVKVGTGLSIDGTTHVLSATSAGADATTTVPGQVEIRTAAGGAHPVALTTDDLAAASGVASLDSSSHGVQQPTRDATEAATNDTLASSSSVVNNLNRIRYQLAQLGTGAWSSLRAMVQLSPSGQQTGAINVSGEVQASDFKPGGLTGATAASRYVGATLAGAPSSGTFAVGDYALDQTGKIWVCTTAGSPGTWTQTATGTFTGEVQGTDFKATGLTGATAASRYVGGTASGAPVSGTFLLGDWVLDQTGKIWVCTTAGSPGTWTQLAGGSGSATLAGDSDVSLSSPAEADRLRYSASDSKWHNTAKVWQPVTTGGSSPEIVFAGGDVVMAEV